MKKIFLLIIPILIHVFLVIFLMKPYVIDNSVDSFDEFSQILQKTRLEKVECSRIFERNDIICIVFVPKNNVVSVSGDEILEDMHEIRKNVIEYVVRNNFGTQNIVLLFKQTRNIPWYELICSNFELTDSRNDLFALKNNMEVSDFSYYECNYISSEDKLKFIEHPKKLKVYVEEVKNISFINEWKDIEYINFTDTYFDDEQKEFLKKFSEENNCTIMIK